MNAQSIELAQRPGQTMMMAIHAALRRDLERLVAAADEARADGAARWLGVRAGWELFWTQLHIHHTFEDTHVWPRLRRHLEDAGGSVAALDDMEPEHAAVGELLSIVDASFADSASEREVPASDVQRLARALREHLAHEEMDVLPLLGRYMTSADHRALSGLQRREQGLRGAAQFLPWVLDGAPPSVADVVTRVVPLPARVLLRQVWQPRYARRRLWTGTAAGPYP